MNRGRHIFLTGFMGSGKSTVGKKLSGILKLPFIDLDKVIEQEQGRSVTDIFETSGENTFREIEKQTLSRAVESASPAVIALGGGTVCDTANLQLIKNNGLLVYLQMPVKALVSRLQHNRSERPLLKNTGNKSLEEIISEKLHLRKNFYESAHIIVNGVNLTAQELCRIIVEETRHHTNNT